MRIILATKKRDVITIF